MSSGLPEDLKSVYFYFWFFNNLCIRTAVEHEKSRLNFASDFVKISLPLHFLRFPQFFVNLVIPGGGLTELPLSPFGYMIGISIDEFLFPYP